MGPAMKNDPFSPSPTSPPSKTPLLRRPLSPLPPPPPLSSHPLFRSSLPPLPPPWTHSRGHPMVPPGYGPPPPAAGTPASSLRVVEHPVARTRGARPDRDDDDLAGVPPELLPLKKRIVRHHPYAAAWAIQEMASRGGLVRRREEHGLRAELLRLRISRPALVLTKPLTISDRNRDMARLVLPERLVRASPLLGMLTAPERCLALGPGLSVRAFDRLGRTYRMTLRHDPSARTFLLRGQWTLYLSRHDTREGDAVELLAFRPSAWQARLDRHGEAGLGMAVLHCPDADRTACWTRRERDAADGLLIAAAANATASSCRLTGGNGLDSTPLPVSNLVEVRG